MQNNTTRIPMENKMTAVQWLFNEVINYNGIVPVHVIEQAAEMEKEQHGKTWDDAITQYIARGFNSERTVCDFDEYYAGNYE
jgi:hypothetical protein